MTTLEERTLSQETSALTRRQNRDAAWAGAPFQPQGALMAIGVEPERIRACLLEPVSGRYRPAAWLGRPRHLDHSPARETAELCREMGRRLNRRLWDDATDKPYTTSEQPLQMPPIEQLAVALSPIPWLPVGIMGLSPGHSTHAAQEAVKAGPGQAVSVCYFSPQMQAQRLADELRAARVQAFLLVGGYDMTPPAPHSALYALLSCAANALQILTDDERPVVYFAGSRWAAEHAERVLSSVGETTPVLLPNLTPSPIHERQNVVAQALHLLYAAKARQTPGYAELAAWSNGGSAPRTLESNFARLVRAWRDLHDLPDLHGLYLLAGARLHVWASARRDAVVLRYAGEQETPTDLGETELDEWPPIRLLCGGSGRGFRPPAELRWWDRGAMAPLIVALGAVAPLAVRQVLQYDLLVEL